MGRDSEGVIRAAGGITFTVRFDLTLGSIETDQQIKEYNYIRFIDGYTLRTHYTWVDILPLPSRGGRKNKEFLLILRKNKGVLDARKQNFH